MISEIVTDESAVKKMLVNSDVMDDVSVACGLECTPRSVSEQKVLESINPAKDVDGFHPENIGKLYIDQQTFVPCTPLGIMELLNHADIDLEGKDAVVIGRSHIVGQPVSKLLLQKNASVTILHSRTKDMKRYLKKLTSSLVCGRPGLVTKDDVKEGAVVIDVGNTPDENGKLKGDIAYDEVKEIAGAITPVPGGVGPMTITMVLNNTLMAEKMRRGIE